MASTLLSLKLPDNVTRLSDRYSDLVNLDNAIKSSRYTVYALCEMYDVAYGEEGVSAEVLEKLKKTKAGEIVHFKKLLCFMGAVGFNTDMCLDDRFWTDASEVNNGIRLCLKVILRNLCSTVLEDMDAREVALVEAVVYE